MSETDNAPVDRETTSGSPVNAFTIISKNYLPQARVFVDSLLRSHPGSRVFVFLYDDVDGYFDPSAEQFEVILADVLRLPRWNEFSFKYSIVERCTAIKPYCFRYLFGEYGLPHVVYFDPDILVYSPLTELVDVLNTYPIVITPHLTDPLPRDGELLFEDDILRAGSYNLGFLALRKADTTHRLLDWWEDRLYDSCKVRQAKGLFVDQRWFDLVPGLFPDVCILRHEGYNVAYWNLPTRTCRRSGEAYTFNGYPLRFFHFSSFDPRKPEIASKYSTRQYFATEGETATIYQNYAALLIESGFLDTVVWPNSFEFYDNGAAVGTKAHDVYYDLAPEVREKYGNPYATRDPNCFYEYVRGLEISGAIPPTAPQGHSPNRPERGMGAYRSVKEVLKKGLLPLLRNTLGRNQRLWNRIKVFRQRLRTVR